jgi:hypothetical protein
MESQDAGNCIRKYRKPIIESVWSVGLCITLLRCAPSSGAKRFETTPSGSLIDVEEGSPQLKRCYQADYTF